MISAYRKKYPIGASFYGESLLFILLELAFVVWYVTAIIHPEYYVWMDGFLKLLLYFDYVVTTVFGYSVVCDIRMKKEDRLNCLKQEKCD